MADDKLKTDPESPVLDHPDGGPVGDAQAVTKIPAPEEVEGPAAGTGPAPQPEQSVIPGMGKDAPAQPVPQVEAEKTGKSLNQDKKVEPEEKTAKRRGRPPKEQDHPQGSKAEKGPKPLGPRCSGQSVQRWEKGQGNRCRGCWARCESPKGHAWPGQGGRGPCPGDQAAAHAGGASPPGGTGKNRLFEAVGASPFPYFTGSPIQGAGR